MTILPTLLVMGLLLVVWRGFALVLRTLHLISAQQSLIIGHLDSIQRYSADLARIEAEESADRRRRATAVSAHRGVGRELLAERLAARLGEKT